MKIDLDWKKKDCAFYKKSKYLDADSLEKLIIENKDLFDKFS